MTGEGQTGCAEPLACSGVCCVQQRRSASHSHSSHTHPFVVAMPATRGAARPPSPNDELEEASSLGGRKPCARKRGGGGTGVRVGLSSSVPSPRWSCSCMRLRIVIIIIAQVTVDLGDSTIVDHHHHRSIKDCEKSFAPPDPPLCTMVHEGVNRVPS